MGIVRPPSEGEALTGLGLLSDEPAHRLLHSPEEQNLVIVTGARVHPKPDTLKQPAIPKNDGTTPVGGNQHGCFDVQVVTFIGHQGDGYSAEAARNPAESRAHRDQRTVRVSKKNPGVVASEN